MDKDPSKCPLRFRVSDAFYHWKVISITYRACQCDAKNFISVKKWHLSQKNKNSCWCPQSYADVLWYRPHFTQGTCFIRMILPEIISFSLIGKWENGLKKQWVEENWAKALDGWWTACISLGHWAGAANLLLQHLRD